ncbi:MAG: hypothetical protein ACR2G6_03690 [Gemmatimonadaceae bacterium]
MSEWRNFRSELRVPKSDVAVLVTTFALTVAVDITVAIEVGMVLAAFPFMRRMAAAEQFKDTIGQIAAKPEVLIIRIRRARDRLHGLQALSGTGAPRPA